MFNINSASVGYLQVSSSLSLTSNSSINISNNAEFSASVISASAIYGPSYQSDTYTPAIDKNFTMYHSVIDNFPVTASTVNTIYKQWYVPGNVIRPGDLLQFAFSWRHSGSATLTARIYVNSGSSSVGTLLGTSTDSATVQTMQRFFSVLTTASVLIHGAATFDANTGFGADNASGPQSPTIPNLTGSTYWNFAIQAAAASTQSLFAAQFRLYKG